MRRREFITIIGGTALSSLAARAQQAGKLPRIGFMGAGTASSWSEWTAAFLERLQELGWIEGRSVAIEYRWAEGSTERYGEIAEEFVRLKVDVIVTAGGDAAKRATSTIPIVVALMADPVGQGLVSNLARPDGNVTGMSVQATDLAGKRLELLRETVPGLRRVAVLTNPGFTGAGLELREIQAAAKTLGLEVIAVPISRVDEISRAFEALGSRAEAVYVSASQLANTNRIHINELAIRERLPTMHGFRPYVEAGGLISYGPNTAELFRRAAGYVDKILRGAKPGELPIEQPTKFDLIVNIKTAKALGLDVPPTLLARADEVIE